MKENHGETNWQYKRKKRGETLGGELVKEKNGETLGDDLVKEKKKYCAELKQGKRITVKQMGSIRGKDTVKH